MTCAHGLHDARACPLCRADARVAERVGPILAEALSQARAASYLEGRRAGLEEAAQAVGALWRHRAQMGWEREANALRAAEEGIRARGGLG